MEVKSQIHDLSPVSDCPEWWESLSLATVTSSACGETS